MSEEPVQASSVPIPHLLKAGTAIYPTMTFAMQADAFKVMSKEGREVPDQPNLRAFTGELHVSWIDNDGEEHFPEVSVVDISVEAQTGHIRFFRPLTRRANFSPSRLQSVRNPLAAIWHR
jgi:hypothetical protein